MKIQGKEITYIDLKARPELWPVIEAEVEWLQADAIKHRRASRTNDGVLFSELASSHAKQLADKCTKIERLQAKDASNFQPDPHTEGTPDKWLILALRMLEFMERPDVAKELEGEFKLVQKELAEELPCKLCSKPVAEQKGCPVCWGCYCKEVERLREQLKDADRAMAAVWRLANYAKQVAEAIEAGEEDERDNR